MSAYMVSKVHIDRLVATAFYGPVGVAGWRQNRPSFRGFTLTLSMLDDLGETLIKENLSSIHHRYPDTITDPDATPGPNEMYWLKPYFFPTTAKPLPLVAALKAIDSYEYQSCEHSEWVKSDAAVFCGMLRHYLINVLPGYETAEWELTV